MSALAPASSPFQRIVDALSCRSRPYWTVEDLAQLGDCSVQDAELCVERLASEEVLEQRGRGRWVVVGEVRP